MCSRSTAKTPPMNRIVTENMYSHTSECIRYYVLFNSCKGLSSTSRGNMRRKKLLSEVLKMNYFVFSSIQPFSSVQLSSARRSVCEENNDFYFTYKHNLQSTCSTLELCFLSRRLPCLYLCCRLTLSATPHVLSSASLSLGYSIFEPFPTTPFYSLSWKFDLG